MNFRNPTVKTGRNDPCPCGSGKKFKHCCGTNEASARQARRPRESATELASRDIPRAIQTAMHHHHTGNLARAEALYRQVLKVQPRHPEALHLLGVIALQAGKPAAAAELIRKAIEVNPKAAPFHLNLGLALKAQGRLEEATASLEQALRLQPDFVQAHYNLGSVLRERGLSDRAVACYRQALALKPDYPEVHNNLGNALKELGNLDESIACYRKALELKPDYPEAHNNLGNALAAQQKLEAAIACYRKALELKPDYPEAHNNLGNALAAQGKPLEAVDCYRKTLTLRPDHAQGHYNLGNALTMLGRPKEAEACYRKAIALNLDSPEVHNNLGNALTAQKRLEEAIACYRQALALKPDYSDALDNLVGTQLRLCDWSELAEVRTRLLAPALAAGENNPHPLRPFNVVTLPLPITPAEQQIIARAFVRKQTRWLADTRQQLDFRQASGPRERLRIGYISTDFYSHATTYLIQGLFGRHDRSRFEVYAYSLGEDDGSIYRQRIIDDCDQFRDVRPLSIEETARQIHRDGIDILIDLNGHTANNRMESLALRPAPIQVGYLGFPGTTGADFMDYIITDQIATPPELQAYFDEKFVYLPDTYQVNDRDREIAEETPSRAECGLPEEGFVFCCFNNHYKIEPMIFDVWVQILNRVEGSVLWLLGGPDAVVTNLRREAQARGLAGDRLIFGAKLPVREHLARHRNADLFLDTHYYNAHTTASDALWASLPVLTCPGDTFASRVGASLLNAVGLPELVAPDLKIYAETAVRLAENPEKLRGLRTHLAENRLTYPLFDTTRFARHLERAYERMWEIHRSGTEPTRIDV